RASLPAPSDTTQPTEARARAYLHANCAFCHRPQGPGRGVADFRFSRDLAGTHVCNALPGAGSLGIDGAHLFTPGDPSHSTISVRTHRTDSARMPPLASAIVDEAGTALLDAWISSVATCP